MTSTSKLGLQLLANSAGNQIQSNSTFAQLNQLVQAGVVDKDLATPPGSPVDEALYIVASTPTGAWSGWAGRLAYWLTSTGAWQSIAPREGMLVHVNDEDQFYKYTGSAWTIFTGGSFTGGSLTSALNEAPPATVASAASTAIGAAAANSVNISGTTTITSFDTIAAGATRRLIFAGALTLTHNATSLILPTGANIATGAGDVAGFMSLGGGNWKCIDYVRANGTSLAGSFTGGTLTGALNEAPIATLASAATTNIGAAAANTVSITGTTTITGLGTIADGAKRTLVFASTLALTHNATSLILPTGANITTAAGDIAEFTSLGSGNWRCTCYQRANGQPLAFAGTLTGALNEAPIATVASAATTDIGAAAANTVSVTGTTTITALGTIASGARRTVVFTGALTLTHNATSLILPTASNIATAAGDSAQFVSLGSGNWRCVSYMRASGAPMLTFTGGTLTSALNEAPNVSIASAGTVNIGAAAANTIVITGTTTITAFDTIAAGAIRRLLFAGALTLTHNATSMILPGAANIITAAGDTAEFVSLGSGNWVCFNYMRGDGTPLLMPNQLVIPGSSARIRGDLSPLSSLALMFQTNTANSATRMQIIPFGTGAQTGFYAYNLEDSANASYAALRALGSDIRLQSGFNGSASQLPLCFYINNTLAWQIDASSPYAFRPGVDNTYTIGTSSFRPSVIYAATGTINTSDAREKTRVRQLEVNEISAAKALAKEVGAYRFLGAIEMKGEEARDHIGLTVQRAIEVMLSFDLDPMRYGFICYDTWDRRAAVLDEEGEEVSPAADAGERYGFRMDELLMFIASGFEARLNALEEALALS